MRRIAIGEDIHTGPIRLGDVFRHRGWVFDDTADGAIIMYMLGRDGDTWGERITEEELRQHKLIEPNEKGRVIRRAIR